MAKAIRVARGFLKAICSYGTMQSGFVRRIRANPSAARGQQGIAMSMSIDCVVTHAERKASLAGNLWVAGPKRLFRALPNHLATCIFTAFPKGKARQRANAPGPEGISFNHASVSDACVGSQPY
jgi:hypothetical protein